MKKIILFITIFLLAIPAVSASQVTLVKNRIEDTYTYYYDKELQRDRYLYASRYTFGDTIAYCLEIGKTIDSNIYTYTTSLEEFTFPAGALDYIKLIAYYGYDYPGHQTDNYYMATQEIIWSRLTNIPLSWIKNMDPSDKINLRKEKDEIMSLFITHYTKPSFDSAEIDLNIGEELVLEDTNNVLNRYVASSDDVRIEGNKLIISKNFSEEEIIFTKPDYSGKSFLLYTSGLSQKMLSAGSIDHVSSILKINLLGGTLTLNKLDKDTTTAQGEATLDGAIYELYDEEGLLMDTLITGTKNKIESLPLGKYTLKEKTPPEGYLLDEYIYTFEITKDNLNITLDVYDEVIKREVEIYKVFASNTTGQLLGEPNITFEIYDEDRTLVNTITTDSEGYASIILPYGTYTFKQINTTENYQKVEDFTVTISESDTRPIHKLLSDSAITAKVKIIKKDLDTKENILDSSIKFKIFDVKNNKYLSLKVSYPENKVTEEFQVDKNGTFITPISLPAGDYILEEVPKSLHGYLYNSTKVPFTINASSDLVEEDGELYLEIPFYNKRVKGALSLTKYGEEVEYKDNSYYYKEIPLESVIFALYAKEDIYENNRLIYKQDELVEELITDGEGKIQKDNLPLGNYYLKEVSTVGSHLLSEETYSLELSYQDETTEVVTQSLDIKNYLPKGKLIITKYESNSSKTIPNTLIEVCSQKDNKVVYKGYTDEQGQIIIEDLPYGEYYLSEVEASTGYRLLEEEIPFEINSASLEINIYNERIEVPNTGFTLTPLAKLSVTLIPLGIILIIFFPKEKIVVFLSIIVVILSLTYLIYAVYRYHSDNTHNQESIDAYLNNTIDTVTDEKYQYNAILEIPSVNLKRGILDINNKYNKAQYNIELIKEDENAIVLAAHNGSNHNSYFGSLHTIEIGDEINYYQDGIVYHYIYSDSYDIKKNGYADLYYKKTAKSIILITCKDGSDDAQTVYIGYLKSTSGY